MFQMIRRSQFWLINNSSKGSQMFTPGPSTLVMLQLLLDFDVDVAY